MLIRRSFQWVVVLALSISLITSGGAAAQRDQGPVVQPAADGPAGPIGLWPVAEDIPPADGLQNNAADRAIEIVALRPDLPAISLNKTVGTDPEVCATTDNLNLPFGGGEVTYCYTVLNIGDTTVTLHTLVDNELGTILNSFPYSLIPGASAFITQAATITQTTVNTATWTVFNPGPTNTAVATDTATVNVPVALPAISLNKTVGTDPAVCATTDNVTLPIGGGEVTYCYEVENTGNISLELHTLVDSELGTILNNFPYTLVPGAKAFLTTTATITQSTLNEATWTATATSLPGPPITAGFSDTALVVVPAALSSIMLNKTVGVDPEVCAATDNITLPAGGGEVTYCYTVENTGNIILSLHTLVDNELGTLLNSLPYSLAPGASAFLTESATITQTTINTATWTAFNPGPTDTAVATDTATVNVPVALPSISLNKTAGTDPADCAATDNITLPAGGGTVTYCYTVENTGNITLSLHTLVDNELGTLLNSLPYSLAPGASAFLTESATITRTTVTTATWTAFNPGPTDTAIATDTATVAVELYRLYLPLMRR